MVSPPGLFPGLFPGWSGWDGCPLGEGLPLVSWHKISSPGRVQVAGRGCTSVPGGLMEGWGEKGKSKRLPFPPLKSRAKKPLDLVHSDLDEIPVLSMGGFKYTATYLDDYSSFGVMFYLKKKNDEFAAFKQYKAWAKRQLGTTLKCR